MSNKDKIMRIELRGYPLEAPCEFEVGKRSVVNIEYVHIGKIFVITCYQGESMFQTTEIFTHSVEMVMFFPKKLNGLDQALMDIKNGDVEYLTSDEFDKQIKDLMCT